MIYYFEFENGGSCDSCSFEAASEKEAIEKAKAMGAYLVYVEDELGKLRTIWEMT